MAGWGVTNQTPVILPENLKIIRLKIYDKTQCKAGKAVETNNQVICAAVPGMLLQTPCQVITKSLKSNAQSK